MMLRTSPPSSHRPPHARLLPACVLLVVFALAPALAWAAAGGEGDSARSRFGEGNAFEVWKKEHRWVRIGMRAYGYVPAVDEHSALHLGAGITIPVTLDFFMGLGMKIAFTGVYNQGNDCVNRGVPGTDPDCPDGQVGGVDFQWREPLSQDDSGATVVDGTDPEASPSSTTYVSPQRRSAHVAQFALTIGVNYELTLPNIQVFRIVQPFFGGGVAIVWVHTYSDIKETEFVLIYNDMNDPYDSNNMDPWSDQGPEVGGEVYGGTHFNLTEVFRVSLELGYMNVSVPETTLKKATEGFDTKHLDYRMSSFRFGGGFEFRF